MEIIGFSAERVQLSLDHEAILIINSALNEICNGIDIQEFDTRIGVSLVKARGLLEEIGGLLEKMESR